MAQRPLARIVRRLDFLSAPIRGRVKPFRASNADRAPCAAWSRTLPVDPLYGLQRCLTAGALSVIVSGPRGSMRSASRAPVPAIEVFAQEHHS
jgi:hypothetical protein